jgi:hypothetical protein
VRVVALPAAVLTETGGCLLAALLPAEWALGDRVGVALIGTAVTAVLLMMARPAVVADESGVTVVNLLARRRLAWSEVVQVGLGRDDPWVTLDLADGTTMSAMALQAADGDRARRGAAELARLVRAYGEANGGGR